MARLARLALGFACALLFVGLIVRQIDLSGLSGAFRGTRLRWLAAALGMFCIGYACRIARWREMLVRDSPQLRWIDCAGPLLAGFATNNVLPFRAGDVLRALAFNRELGTNAGSVFASLFVERLLDLLMVLVVFGAALRASGLDANRIIGLAGSALFALSLLIAVALLVPKVFARVALGAALLATRMATDFGKRVAREIAKAVETLEHLSGGRLMLRLITWSALAWSSEGAVFWCAARAFPALPKPSAGWLALPIGTLATLIPSTPGYVGTFDYFTIRAMTLTGNPPVASAAYALLVHALLWLPPTLAGGIYLLTRHARMHLKEMRGDER